MLDAPLNRGYDSDGNSSDRPQGEGLRGRAAAQQYRKAAPDPSRYERGPGNDLSPAGAKPRLRTALRKGERAAKTAVRRLTRAEMLDTEKQPGFLEAEEGEKTYTIRQETIVPELDVQTAKKRYDLHLPALGPYLFDYSTNGNAMVLLGRKGHLACVKWKTFSLQSETQLKEKCYDVTYLNDDQLFAVAQKKYTYIYGNDGVEVHQLRNMAEVRKLEYLPQHFLLCGGSATGILTWFDISTGQVQGMQRSRLGEIQALRRDPSNNVLTAGHTNGLVTLWSPKASEALVKLAAHRGAIADVALDRTGNYLVTLGVDAYTRIWDMRTMQNLHQYPTERGTTLDISYTGLLAVGLGHRVEVWKDALAVKQPKPYMAHNFDSALTQSQRVVFCPYEDVLGVATSFGFASFILPGAGCPTPDFYHANVFETKKQQKERPIHQLLDKLPPDSISLGRKVFGGQSPEQLEAAKRSMKERQAARTAQNQREGGIHDNAGKVMVAVGDEEEDSDPDHGIVDTWQKQQDAKQRLANKHKIERDLKKQKRLNKMEGVDKYKLKQRTQGRKEVRMDRRRMKREMTREKEPWEVNTEQQQAEGDKEEEGGDTGMQGGGGPNVGASRFLAKGFKRVKKSF